ncbi:MAG: A24 family peptidase [Pseudoruegeria sp.]
MLPAASDLSTELLVVTVLFGCIFVKISTLDLLYYKIPNILSGTLALTGIITVFGMDVSMLFSHMLSGFISFLLFFWLGAYLFRRLQQEAFGIGDAKLIGACTIWIGPMGIPSALFIASFLACMMALFTKLAQKLYPKSKVAFGPYLCIGTYIVWLYGPLTI